MLSPPSSPPALPSISALLNRIVELEEALRAHTDPPPPPLPPSPSPPPPPPPASPALPSPLAAAADHNWNVIGSLAGLAGLLLLLLLAAALFYFRKHRRFTNVLRGLRTTTSTLERRHQSLSDVGVELPAALVERMNDAPGPSEVTDPVEVERDAGRQLLRDKIAESGGGGGGGLGLASNGRMSPLPADEPHFDVVEAISEAGSADAALLAAVCRYASAAEVRELLEHGASPNTSFLHHSALALAVRCCSSQASKALLDARANVDSKDPQGWTALMHAIDAHSPTFSRETILVQLLDAGAAVDVWGHDLRGPFELMEEKVGVGEKSHSRATGERRPHRAYAPRLQPLLPTVTASLTCGGYSLSCIRLQASGASPSSCTSTAVRRRCSSCPTTAATRRARQRHLCRALCRSRYISIYMCRPLGPPTRQMRRAAPPRTWHCSFGFPAQQYPSPPSPTLLFTTEIWWGVVAGGRPLLSRALASAFLITPSGGDRPPRGAYGLEASRSRA